MMRKSRIALVVLVATLAGIALPASAQDKKVGQAIAARNCAHCHAIGTKGTSRMAQATPFREIHKKYPIDNLEEAFAEGVSGNHLGMPDFEFSPREVGDLLAYIKSLTPKRR